MRNSIDIVISGGQTGADQGGLTAAKACGIRTSGYAPRGFMTTSGSDPSLKDRFNLVESAYGYARRTRMNVENSDATIIIASNIKSPGTVLTIKCLKDSLKPYVLVTYSPEVSFDDWLYQSSLKKSIDMIDSMVYNPIINIAGNSDQTCQAAYKFSLFFCTTLFQITNGPNL